MVTRTPAPPRPRLKHAFTATAMAWFQVRGAWRSYFQGLAEEHRAAARRGWGR